jgi:hypothetical protein
MRLIIAGSRHLRIDAEFIELSLKSLGIRDQVEEVISGGAPGVDWAAEEFAIDFLDKEAKVMQAEWINGVQAGPARNKKMAEVGDALLLIWDGRSSGSADMKTQMLKQRKPIYEVIIKGEES